jgi:hypothetical protein
MDTISSSIDIHNHLKKMHKTCQKIKTFTHKPQGSIQLNSFDQKIVDYDALCKTYIFCHNIGVFNKVLPATMPRENLSQLATLTRE